MSGVCKFPLQAWKALELRSSDVHLTPTVGTSAESAWWSLSVFHHDPWTFFSVCAHDGATAENHGSTFAQSVSCMLFDFLGSQTRMPVVDANGLGTDISQRHESMNR